MPVKPNWFKRRVHSSVAGMLVFVALLVEALFVFAVWAPEALLVFVSAVFVACVVLVAFVLAAPDPVAPVDV